MDRLLGTPSGHIDGFHTGLRCPPISCAVVRSQVASRSRLENVPELLHHRENGTTHISKSTFVEGSW